MKKGEIGMLSGPFDCYAKGFMKFCICIIPKTKEELILQTALLTPLLAPLLTLLLTRLLTLKNDIM